MGDKLLHVDGLLTLYYLTIHIIYTSYAIVTWITNSIFNNEILGMNFVSNGGLIKLKIMSIMNFKQLLICNVICNVFSRYIGSQDRIAATGFG